MENNFNRDNFNIELYKGNSIFRNQPPHTFFNKSYEDVTDALFLGLNEIDPCFMQQEQLDNKDHGFQCQAVQDPRTKQTPQQTVYYHRSDQIKGNIRRVPIFRNGTNTSSLNKAQHKVCLQVLQAQQNHLPVDESNLFIWRRLVNERNKEKQLMQKFVYDYAQKHKELIYEPTKRLVALYKLWYERRVELLLIEEPENLTFNTHLGMPHVRVCNADKENNVEITDVQWLERKGYVPIWAEEKEEQRSKSDCKGMHFSLETCFDYYNQAWPAKEKLLGEEIKHHLSKTTDTHKFFIPMESLLFLLTAGDYPDLPTELLLSIQTECEGEAKLINLQKPLPARNCGWHTHKKVVEQAFEAYSAVPGRNRWLKLNGDTVTVESDGTTAEMDGCSKAKIEYKVEKFNDFVLNQSKHFKQNENKLKSNSALVKWQLTSNDSNQNPLEILTTITLTAALNESATKFLPNQSIKLEYKPQFGCEIMTKYELLEAWLQMRLMNASPTAEYGQCTRIHVDNFSIQLTQFLTLLQVEQELAETYHVNLQHLLANLAEFLKLLLNMPKGKYMLRYNYKFKDKLLLCAPSQEITQNTIYLHALLQTAPTDMVFMTQPHFLSIADNLCSIMHLQHSVLPCAFNPHSHQAPNTSRGHKTPLDDRANILKRMEEKRKLKAQFHKRKLAGHKRKQKNKRKTKLNVKTKQEQQQQRQTNEEMERFLGF